MINIGSEIIDSQTDYHTLLESRYLNICKNKKVLELGPGQGNYTKFIIKNNPAYLEVIEGYLPHIDDLKKIDGIDNVVFDDAMLNLQQKKSFDVVVLFGLLYHLHSPLHLLELIVNNCNPEYLIMDSVNGPVDRPVPLEILVGDETTNVVGNAQTRKDWRSTQLKFVVVFDIFDRALKNLGYTRIQHHQLQIDGYVPKSKSWLALWKLNDLQETKNDKSI